jgi:hypothetical protein
MNFLSLTNRILKAFNETQLTSTTFNSAYGFYAEAQDAVNRAIFDIYTEEDTKWPFAWLRTTFTTTPGVQAYTLNSSYFAIDWDSFMLPKPQITISSISLVGTTVTVNTSAPHQLIVGDAASLYNINDSATNVFYNANLGASATTGWTVLTTPTGSQFTFSVPASSPTPSVTGTSYMQPPYQSQAIDLIDWNTYKDSGNYANDLNGKVPQAVPSSYAQPSVVVRMNDNSIVLSSVPDRIYTIQYDGFVLPTALSAYSDTPTMPLQWEQIIVDKALHYAYMFRDNVEQAEIAEQRYTKNVNKMRRILIPQTEYLRFEG